MRNAMTKQTLKPMEKAEILRRNPMVDPVLVAKYEKLELELHRLGVDTKPKYNITPPLGGPRLHLFNE